MAPPLSSSKLHHLLRQVTKPSHHALDHHPLLVPLLKTDISPAQYGDALAALHGVQAAAEAAILKFLVKQPGLLDYAPRRKLSALLSDLTILQRIPVKTATEFPLPDSVPALIGVLYVIEGATLGGQLIARNLRKAGLNHFPFSFFEVYGDLSGQRWDEFWHFVDAQCPPEADGTAADWAVAMFSAIQRHMDACQQKLRQQDIS